MLAVAALCAMGFLKANMGFQKIKTSSSRVYVFHIPRCSMYGMSAYIHHKVQASGWYPWWHAWCRHKTSRFKYKCRFRWPGETTMLCPVWRRLPCALQGISVCQMSCKPMSYKQISCQTDYGGLRWSWRILLEEAHRGRKENAILQHIDSFTPSTWEQGEDFDPMWKVVANLYSGTFQCESQPTRLGICQPNFLHLIIWLNSWNGCPAFLERNGCPSPRPCLPVVWIRLLRKICSKLLSRNNRPTACQMWPR